MREQVEITEKNRTPLMRQYWDIKSLHPDKILLFRMGDFFEMFFDDAVVSAPILNIALTQRNKKSKDETPMCGVPHHSITGPINKLLAAGRKIAICEQLEDPKLAKGLVKRGVTRVLTPGMVFDPEATIQVSESQYMACFDGHSISFLETSTGEFFCFEASSVKRALQIAENLKVVEWVFESDNAAAEFFKESNHQPLVSCFSIDQEDSAFPVSARRLKLYATSLSDSRQVLVKDLEMRGQVARLELSATVLRHLEIFETTQGKTEGSLIQFLDRCQTPAGSRLLRQWLAFPRTEKGPLLLRQKKIAKLSESHAQLKVLRSELGKQGDIERRLYKLTQSGSSARELVSLVHAISVAHQVLEKAPPEITDWTPSSSRPLLNLCEVVLTELKELSDLPLTTRLGGLFQRGRNEELNKLIELSENSNQIIVDLEIREKAATGISSLKVRYNQVFGYYFEVTNTHKEKVPDHYKRKQTLASAERFYTDELLEIERKVLSAQKERAELEFKLFEELRQQMIGFSQSIFMLALASANLDLLAGLSWVSLEQNWVTPTFSDQDVKISGSRHPVVESLSATKFVANDISLNLGEAFLITGPNMAGKSTLMRQLALTVILAQIGSNVPASRAELPLFDRVLTRIGASDQIAEGLSTFMVEMTETAEILNYATAKSLIIMDEIGRGTATYDGMSLAQALLEHLLSQKVGCLLFATHYHELAKLESLYPQLKNIHLETVEHKGQLKFLYRIIKGPALKSYGVKVAELAGLPRSVTTRAQQLLKGLENRSFDQQMSLVAFDSDVAPVVLESEEKEKFDSYQKQLQALDLNSTTPMQALLILGELKKI